MANRLEEALKSRIDGTIRLCIGGCPKEVKTIKEEAQKIVDAIGFQPSLIKYKGDAYESFRQRVAEGEVHTSSFLGDLFYLQVELGVIDPPAVREYKQELGNEDVGKLIDFD